ETTMPAALLPPPGQGSICPFDKSGVPTGGGGKGDQMFAASQATFFCKKGGPAGSARQDSWQEPRLLSVEDEGGNAVFTHFFCGSDLGGHTASAFERARRSSSALNVVCNLWDQRDQCRCRILAWVVREEPVHVGENDEEIGVH